MRPLSVAEISSNTHFFSIPLYADYRLYHLSALTRVVHERVLFQFRKQTPMIATNNEMKVKTVKTYTAKN